MSGGKTTCGARGERGIGRLVGLRGDGLEGRMVTRLLYTGSRAVLHYRSPILDRPS